MEFARIQRTAQFDILSDIEEGFPMTGINKKQMIGIFAFCVAAMSSNMTMGIIAYIMQAYCTSSSASFTDVNEQWVLVPSDSFSKLEGDVASQFTSLKSGLLGFTPDDVFIIGEARFKDNALVELNIDVNLHAKTAAEAIALSQYISGQMSVFTGTNYEITIDICSDNEHVAVIRRSAGSADAQTIMLI